LGIEDEDQNAFSRLLNLINLSEFTDSTEIEIKDINSEMHSVTVLQFKEIMKLYGLHCYQVFKG
jgi:CO dehydrogenase/acetyl-CoA synthase gamma subunit (corrinoid Fe-S protein)